MNSDGEGLLALVVGTPVDLVATVLLASIAVLLVVNNNVLRTIELPVAERTSLSKEELAVLDDKTLNSPDEVPDGGVSERDGSVVIIVSAKLALTLSDVEAAIAVVVEGLVVDIRARRSNGVEVALLVTREEAGEKTKGGGLDRNQRGKSDGKESKELHFN